MNCTDGTMDEWLGLIAVTERGRGEYLRLARAAGDTIGQWDALGEGTGCRAGGPLSGIGGHLSGLVRGPLRISVYGRPLDGGHAAPEDLYRDTYARIVRNNGYLSAMRKAWIEGGTDGIVGDASAIRLLTWQSRDAYDESLYLAGLIGRQAAREIRQRIRPSRSATARRTAGSPRPRPRFTKAEIADPADVYREIAWLQDRDPADVRERVESRIAGGMGRVESIVVEYGARPSAGTMVGIDLETTGTGPGQDYIIDAGWETYDMGDGRAFDAQRHTYGLSRQRERQGIGRDITELTGIATSDVAGHAPFQEDADAQRAVMDALDGRIMVAHNANFERSFLIGNCAGYAEALRDGRIRIVDSMKVARHSEDVRARGFRLDDYARRNHALDDDRDTEVRARGGGLIRLDQGESERHLGLEDAHIMMRAMRGQLDVLHDRYERGERVMRDVDE